MSTRWLPSWLLIKPEPTQTVIITLQEKDEKIIQLERTCHECEKVIQHAETEKEKQRRAFEERLQQIESVTKVSYKERGFIMYQ